MAWLKTISQTDAVKVFLVFNDDTTVNLDASVNKFREVALRQLASQETDDALVSECISDLFDTYRGARMNAAAITSNVVSRMGQKNPDLADPKLFGVLAKRVAEVLKAQTGDLDTQPYSMTRGPKGGTSRKSDQAPVAAPVV